MTQKEKAQNLVWIKLEMVTDDRYAESYEDVRSNDANTEQLRKEVALVLVDEIIQALKDNHDYSKCKVRFDYWEEVKQQIYLL